MTGAATWERVSTDEQTSANQVPDMERFAAHHGHEIVARYQLAESAWNGGKDGGEYRAALKRALDDAYAGHFTVLIIWSLDRLTRGGAEETLRLIRQFRERGCTIVSVQESWLNGSAEIIDAFIAFAAAMAKLESDRRSERVKAGLARRKAEGKAVGGRKAGSKNRKPHDPEPYRQAAARRNLAAESG